jgi:hypothetical protein
MIRNIELLDRFLAFCRRRFSPGAFRRCMDLAHELESQPSEVPVELRMTP